MAETLLHDSGIHARCDEERRRGVTQTVPADRRESEVVTGVEML